MNDHADPPIERCYPVAEIAALLEIRERCTRLSRAGALAEDLSTGLATYTAQRLRSLLTPAGD